MDYTTKTRQELIAICKEKNIKGYIGKKKADILQLLMTPEKEVKCQWSRVWVRENKSDCSEDNVPLTLDENGLRKLTPQEVHQTVFFRKNKSGCIDHNEPLTMDENGIRKLTPQEFNRFMENMEKSKK